MFSLKQFTDSVKIDGDIIVTLVVMRRLEWGVSFAVSSVHFLFFDGCVFVI